MQVLLFLKQWFSNVSLIKDVLVVLQFFLQRTSNIEFSLLKLKYNYAYNNQLTHLPFYFYSSKESEYNLGGLPKFGFITTDMWTSFTLLVGIFFPSCTGKFYICV